MKNYQLLIVLFVLPLSCATKESATVTENAFEIVEGVETRKSNIKEVSKQQNFKVNVENTLGVISLSSEVEFTKDDTIRILNADGSLWYKFSFYYDGSDGKVDFYNAEFNPHVFHPDYFLLGLVVKEKLTNDKFKVEVNQIKSLEKLIEIKDYLVFRSWSDQVLNAFSISFDSNINPIKREGANASEIISFPKDVFFQPVKIKNEWLQVKWGSEGNEEYGWIKWKEDGFLILNLSYFA